MNQTQTQPKVDDPVLLIDWSNLVYRAGYAGKVLLRDPASGIITNTFHYTFRMLESYIATFNPSKIIIAMDSPHHIYVRKKIWPEYKARRKERSPESQKNFSRISSDMKHLTALLGCLPVTTIYWDDLEADDVIAWCCKKLWVDLPKIIISTDKDMLQLISPTVKQFYPGSKERLIGVDNWTDQLSQVLKLDEAMVPTIEQYIEFKCLVGEAGATSDNIPGIKGYGPKKAAAFLKEYGSYKKVMNGTARIPTKLTNLQYRLLSEESEAIMKRNDLLMNLSTYLDGNESGLKAFNGVWNPREFTKAINFWGLAKVASGKLYDQFAKLSQN